MRNRDADVTPFGLFDLPNIDFMYALWLEEALEEGSWVDWDHNPHPYPDSPNLPFAISARWKH
jgi:hypothetical protein